MDRSPADDPAAAERWRDAGRPVDDRVADLMGRMTVEEKAHQLVGYWVAHAAPGGEVAPFQDRFSADAPGLEEVAAHGLGQLTRPYGTAPLTPREGIARLRGLQRLVARGNRFGIPAMVHEECLTGFATYSATVFPTPLAWGASFDAALVERMGHAIGESLRRMGVHQGLAPVLDVTRDYRWGRTEETIGEDPYLVGSLGTAYVRGLESAEVVATLKHFAGYSASRAGRNLAPAAIGPREFADVVVEPFAMALRHGSPRSVMHSYNDVDGVPSAADGRLLSGLLRDELGFTGVLVADYFAISFLEVLHRVADSPADAAELALRAGVDVELPTVRCYGAPLLERIRDGRVPVELLDRAVERVLRLKCELGLLDPGWEDRLAALEADAAGVDHLDPPEHRAIARELAEESMVLLANDGAVLPLRPGPARLSLVGPLADDPDAMLGCYTFPSHVGHLHPHMGLGVDVPTVAEAVRAEFPDAEVEVQRGCPVDEREPVVEGEADRALRAVRAGGTCVLVLGDRAGMFGRGTSGEGTDTWTLDLPGRQREFAEAVLSTGTPTVLVVLSGRPYALDGLAERAAAVVQGFFPGEEGATALAGVLSGRVNPSGRLPVSVPRRRSGHPGTYLHAPLGGPSHVSSLDTTPLYPFGHGLAYTRFAYSALAVDGDGDGDGDGDEGGGPSVPTDGAVRLAATVRNVGDRAGTEVVQLYLGDPVATVVRPVRWLAGFARVALRPGEAARVTFRVHADRTAFTDADLQRVVEPGRIDVAIGPSSAEPALRGRFELVGPRRVLGADRVLTVDAEVTRP